MYTNCINYKQNQPKFKAINTMNFKERFNVLFSNAKIIANFAQKLINGSNNKNKQRRHEGVFL
jgi:hypothetical protein